MLHHLPRIQGFCKEFAQNWRGRMSFYKSLCMDTRQMIHRDVIFGKGYAYPNLSYWNMILAITSMVYNCTCLLILSFKLDSSVWANDSAFCLASCARAALPNACWMSFWTSVDDSYELMRFAMSGWISGHFPVARKRRKYSTYSPVPNCRGAIKVEG